MSKHRHPEERECSTCYHLDSFHTEGVGECNADDCDCEIFE